MTSDTEGGDLEAAPSSLRNGSRSGKTSESSRVVDDDEEMRTALYRHAGTIAIIGGGISGITALRVFDACGMDAVIFEASNGVSGVWSECYPDFGLQIPAHMYGFPDRPLPRGYPDGKTIASYCREYITDNGLEDKILLRSRVVSVSRDVEEGSGVDTCRRPMWNVTIESYRYMDGSAVRSRSTHTFDFVVLATGIYSQCNRYIPSVDGMEEHFRGRVLHSSETADAGKEGRRVGKKVVVVGFGKSAQDCAMVAHVETGVPPILLFRRSHWCIPRKILGIVPMEYLIGSRLSQGLLPPWMEEFGPMERFLHNVFPCLFWLFYRTIEFVLVLQCGMYGSKTGRSLRPKIPLEEDMFCGHGVVSHPNFFSFVHSGKVRAIRGSIRKVLPCGRLLIEVEGDADQESSTMTIEADEIVFATGYRRSFDFLPDELKGAVEEDGIYAYRHMIVPGVGPPNIAFVGSNVNVLCQSIASVLQSAWLADVWSGRSDLPDETTAREAMEAERTWRRDNLQRAGHDARSYMIQLHQMRYFDRLLRDLGAEVKCKRMERGPFIDTLANLLAPVSSSDYKDFVTGEWKAKYPKNYVPDWRVEWIVAVILLFVVLPCFVVFLFRVIVIGVAYATRASS